MHVSGEPSPDQGLNSNFFVHIMRGGGGGTPLYRLYCISMSGSKGYGFFCRFGLN